jgi:DNA-binding response OmpR family regulator
MEPEARTNSSNALSAAPRPLRVLVVDDERDTVLTLMELLRDEGHETKGIHNGRQALQAIREFDADAVIMDIAMPEHSGWDTAREIRDAIGPARPLLIALSGQYTKGADRILSQLAGFDYYLTKPCDPDVLLALLTSVKPSAA